MTLPMSKYEELLETVRNLKRQTIRVRELASPLLDTIVSANTATGVPAGLGAAPSLGLAGDPLDEWDSADFTNERDAVSECGGGGGGERSMSAMDSMLVAGLGSAQHVSTSSEPGGAGGAYRGTWPGERAAMWRSEPATERRTPPHPQDITSVMSFASSSGAAPLDLVLGGAGERQRQQHQQQQLDVKVDMVYSLLAVLGTHECPDMGETLLALSANPDSSRAMRQAGCVPLLVQLVYSERERDRATRDKAARALANLVHGAPDERLRKRETKVLRLLDEVRAYGEANSDGEEGCARPVHATENIIKLSFDEGYRQTICELGGIYALAQLVQADHAATETVDDECVTLRRYAGMALTNLTFGHGRNKALLCSLGGFMRCLVAQLNSDSDELRQVTASVLRNLSWRADAASRAALRAAGAVPALMAAAMRSRREATLKSVLSALWNLSAHCSMNKADICAVPGALGFLVDMLGYRPPSKTLAIIENAGGILRNVSSHVAVRDDYRAVLRAHNCLQVLLQQLKSPSLTVVSNACGTLWNLSAKCAEDQRALWDMGAAPMLRSLNHSKHVMIATGSRAALKNLLSSRPGHSLASHVDATARELGLPALPTLGARKRRALAKDLDHGLSETCDNIEPTSPDPGPGAGLVDAFASLSLGGSASPATPVSPATSHPPAYLPGRNKYSDCSFEYEADGVEQPVDYSQKYSETKLQVAKNYSSVRQSSCSLKNDDSSNDTNSKKYMYTEKCPKAEPTSYSDYAETDLDQPTDYSLRYAENDSDSEDVVCKESITRSPEELYEEQQDTVRTYCTEGTPHETPYNFSTATSMSDLRIDQCIEEEKDQLEINNDKEEKSIKEERNSPERFDKNTSAAEEHKTLPSNKLKSCFSSGLMTPEKPVNYCEEGTPRSFSRVSSFSSLHAEEVSAEERAARDKPVESDVAPTGKSSPDRQKTPVRTEAEASGPSKVVTFASASTAAEETPLMFSRCSSLGSLSSTEQHSIHDDRSSVVSDFSRLTSGIVSPSELPDSPTQTVPPSPRQRRAPLEFPSASVAAPLPARDPPHASVFEDNVRKYKEVNTPIEFSANTSLSSLTIDDEPNLPAAFNLLQVQTVANAAATSVKRQLIPPVADPSNASPQPSVPEPETEPDAGDQAEDDMLAACINIGMQNNRHRQRKQQATANMRPRPSPVKVAARGPASQRTGIPVKARPPPAEPDTDTTRTYCTEDTPAMLSHAGSHSDLSVLSMSSKDRSVAGAIANDDKPDFSDDSSNLSGDNDNMLAECIQSGMPKARRSPATTKVSPPVAATLQQRIFKPVPYLEARDELERYAVEDSPCHFSLRSSLSDLTVDGGAAATVHRRREPKNQPDQYQPGEGAIEAVGGVSRTSSLSSLSVESFGSTENAEQALLEQCISSGMPKGKSRLRPPAPLSSTPQPKNVQVASVVPSAGEPTWMRPAPPTGRPGATDVPAGDADPGAAAAPSTGSNDLGVPTNSFPPNHDENLLTGETKTDPDAINKCADLLDGSVEENEWSDSERSRNRMLDPDAMIESLDRFTAELVSQASHLHHGDTWNDDTSPNDVSFPSISLSAPLAASFNSEHASTMTESTLIAIEAQKVADVVRAEIAMTASTTSVDLDQIKPPSVMESLVSLTSSLSMHSETGQPQRDPVTSAKNSPVAQRKRSLPAGLMVRRALSISSHNVKSLENLVDNTSSVSSSCNLDHVKPPSVMGDYLDMIDMESSMISVASITSEVADVKNDFLTYDLNNKNSQSNWMFDMRQSDRMLNLLTNSATQCHSITDIENINPPSLLNDVTDLCDSVADVATENVYSETTTEVFEECVTHHTVDDVTEYSDANSVTPIQSDFASSSAESTPKRVRHLNRLTPKQRRQLAKERYKTYTVAAEMVIREENKAKLENCSPECTSEPSNSVSSGSDYVTATGTKLTPKERRQMDRARFQTRVLDGSIDVETPAPTPKQKRLENRERFRTRTLSSEDTPGSAPGEELHRMLEQQANIVLDTLERTCPAPVDELLDCETLSLVSNEDESEHNSVSSVNYRTYHKSWGFSKNLPVVQSTCDVNSATVLPVNGDASAPASNDSSEQDQAEVETTKCTGPKIVKPTLSKESTMEPTASDEDLDKEQGKGIRGRRKPLYASPYRQITPPSNKMATKNIKPIKSVTSNLLKNVTTALKTNTMNKLNAAKQTKPTKDISLQHNKTSKLQPPTKIISPKITKSSDMQNGKKQTTEVVPKPLERQGTFTKEDKKSKVVESKIPTPSSTKPVSKIARALPVATTKTSAKPTTPRQVQSRIVSSTSADRDRSRRPPSAGMHGSSSSQSLQSADGGRMLPLAKRSSIPNMTQRSDSTVSASSTESAGRRRQPVASKIASLWKRQDTASRDVKLRNQNTNSTNNNSTHRLSRLGSFIQVEEISVT